MSAFWQDVRYSLRLLMRQRGFAAVAILTLGLGIGASTALFSVIDAAVIRPLPYPHPEQLVALSVEVQRGNQSMSMGPSRDEVRRWRSNPAVAEVCVWQSRTPILVETGEFERMPYQDLSEGCLEMYGGGPTIGRSFVLDDTRSGANSVIILGHAYWQRRFAGSPDAIGRSIRLPDGPTTIVGVAPPWFGRGVGFFRALRYDDAAREQARGTGSSAEARLRSGVTPAHAAAALSAESKVITTSLYERTTRGYASTLRTLAGAVVLILLLACVNVAGLLLARGTARQTELAVRASIGASRARLIRQLLTESLLLAVAAGVVGVALAGLSLDAIVAVVPLALPSDAPATVNGAVLAFAAAAAVTSALLFGLVPALRLSRSARHSLAGTSRRHGSALSRRNGQFLIAAEVTLAMILLAGAGVMVRSFARLVTEDLGFDAEQVAAMQVVPADPQPSILSTYYPRLVEAVREIPSIGFVGAVDTLPLIGGATSTAAKKEGAWMEIDISQIVPNYFEAMGIPLVAGRLPTAADAATARPIAVVSAAAAKALFPGRSAVGGSVSVAGDKQQREIVGVVGNVQHWGAEDKGGRFGGDRPKVYVLFGQSSAARPLSLVIRMRPNMPLPVEQLRAVAGRIGPRVFVEKFRPGADWISSNTIRARHRTQLFGLFGAVGVVLALVGIFSMTAYAVASRTREIGVRMALGARADQVVGTVLRDAVWPVAIGTIAGLAGAAAATKVIASFLFDTSPTDPLTFALVAATLACVGTLAAWIPARHAARVDPLIALRAE
jgi:putative ABC transport system permease protein